MQARVDHRKSGFADTCAANSVDHEGCVVILKTASVKDGKTCISQRKIMKTLIALENIAYHKMPLPECTLSLHYMKAVLPIARDGHLRRNKLVNLKSAFARLTIIHRGGSE